MITIPSSAFVWFGGTTGYAAISEITEFFGQRFADVIAERKFNLSNSEGEELAVRMVSTTFDPCGPTGEIVTQWNFHSDEVAGTTLTLVIVNE